jgi:imidazolonepropionase-like amidohydrolase
LARNQPTLPARIAVDDVWIGRHLGPAVLEQIEGEFRPIALGQAAVQRARVPRLTGAVMPGLVDRHVHLGLVDATALRHTAVVEVYDLGWVPRIARDWKINSPTGGLIRIAGPFMTAVGGYPIDRAWAPPGSVRELQGPADGVRAVDEAAAHGHDLIKVVLHTGGPLLDDATLTALVRAAHRHRLPVGIHAEGHGQARRAFEAGADILVHAPWSESLPDDLLRAMAGSMRWISTFAIHHGADRDRALDNARRFVHLGGRLDYGTDMGNGPMLAGPRAEEISTLHEAGLAGDALLQSLARPSGERLLVDAAVYAPLSLPNDAEDVAAWMSQAHRLTVALAEGAIA